jgi:hypothetical protein
MNEAFRQHAEALHPKFEMLMAIQPASFSALSSIVDRPGIYLLSEGLQHVYVGRTRKIRSRLRMHVGSDPAGASFAVKLARLQINRPATYKRESGLKQLRADPAFIAAFAEARDRIRAMSIRFVEEADCHRQALLEIYATSRTEHTLQRLRHALT